MEIILPENGLEEKLQLTKKENRKLIIKLSFDPTAPKLWTCNPMNIKKVFAKNIIAQYHIESDAQNAEDYFINQFQNKNFEDKEFQQVSICNVNFTCRTLYP